MITEDNFLPESNKFDDTSRLRCATKDVEGPDRKHDTVTSSGLTIESDLEPFSDKGN